MSEEFQYKPYEDPVLAQVKKRMTKGDRPFDALPPSKVICTACPRAAWRWVELTDKAKANAMRGFENRGGWRCDCRTLLRPTYDEFESLPEPDGWTMVCTVQDEAIEERYEKQRKEWEEAHGGHDES